MQPINPHKPLDSENPINGLVALIELIKPEIKTVELETIEKNYNE